MPGGARRTESNAALLVALPPLFETMHRNAAPLSAREVAGIVYAGAVAPGSENPDEFGHAEDTSMRDGGVDIKRRKAENPTNIGFISTSSAERHGTIDVAPGRVHHQVPLFK